MLSHKARCFRPQVVTLEDLVPADNFYRRLDAKLDLSFVPDLVKHCYAGTLGRPSIDPIVFFKLQLIMFFEGIRSDRQLMETVHLNLAHRWYLGYDLNEPVPDHSSLSKIRTRYGVEVFQRFFEHVVELCLAEGLVWGKELYFDGTRVRANAAMESLRPRWFWEAQQQLHETATPDPRHAEVLTEEKTDAPAPDLGATTLRLLTPDTDTFGHGATTPSPSLIVSESPANPLWLIEKYDGTRLSDQRSASYERVTDLKVSPTDPDATPMSHAGGDKAKLGYHTHYAVDGGKARIILGALVTPASVMDNTPMLDLERWVRFHWHLHPSIAVADSKYGTIANITGLESDGLKAYIPITDFSQRTGFYPPERFQYDSKRDLYTCPQGKDLPLYSRRQREQQSVYRADAALCNQCPAKAECTDSQSGRHLFRSFFQEQFDRVKSYAQTSAYQKALRKRMVWVEPLFAEAKQWHRLARFRLRGLLKVNIEGLMTAAGQNLKRILAHRRFQKPTNPAAGVVLQFPHRGSFFL